MTAMFQSTRMLDSAHYGNTFDTKNLRIEAYRACGRGLPDDELANARLHAHASPRSTDPDKPPNTATANILDFEGDLLGGPLGLAATQVNDHAHRVSGRHARSCSTSC